MVGGTATTGGGLFGCALVGLAVTGLLVWITEYYTSTAYRPVRSIAGLVHDRPRHQRHPGPRRLDGSDGAAGDRDLRRHHRRVPDRGPVRHRHRGDDDAGARRHDRRARRLRPGHRQCRRHRRNGGPAEGRAQDHRRARRRRQHHQGGDQGLCHRLGRPRLAGAVRGLHRGPHALFPEPPRQLRAAEPVRRDRPLHRRPAAVSVRRDGHDGGRPRGRRGRGRGAPPVQGDPGHHGRHRQAGLRPRRRHADQGGDQGNDRAVAAAGAGADRAVSSSSGRSRARPTPSPRSARCCSAPSSPASSSPSR